MLRIIVALTILTLTSSATADYNAQSSWAGSCQTGMRQSPIDIITDDARTGHNNYRFGQRLFDGKSYLNPSGIDLKNSFPGSELSMIDGDRQLLLYEALQYHWHTPS